MANPYLGEIRVVPYNFEPRGWAFCNGQTLPIAQNTALFSLLGTTYGGNGRTTFALPNLQGKAPMHAGNGPGLTGRVLGEVGGEASVTLQTTQLPQHTHSLQGDENEADSGSPANNLPAIPDSSNLYAAKTSPIAPMATQAVGGAGGSQPHNNMQPYLTLNFIIALQGVYPSRS